MWDSPIYIRFIRGLDRFLYNIAEGSKIDNMEEDQIASIIKKYKEMICTQQ